MQQNYNVQSEQLTGECLLAGDGEIEISANRSSLSSLLNFLTFAEVFLGVEDFAAVNIVERIHAHL